MPLDTLWWTLTLGLMALGIVGTVVPLIPGPAIILAAAGLHRYLLGAEHSVGWPTFLVLVLLFALAQAADFASGAVGGKYFGATRWGAIGGLLGAIAGIFFGLIGIFIGPIVGALLGEMLAGRGMLPAGKSAWGTLLGTVAGAVVKLLLATLMVAWFLVAALSQAHPR